MSVLTVLMNGSSPRGRGKPPDRLNHRADPRLIPAWAGKTARAVSAAPTAGAHPRVGGENYKQIGMDEARAGSSPRGRGKPEEGRTGTLRGGLIPAWAGKTGWAPTVPGWRWAHPRVGGENQTRETNHWRTSGSSPRGRGKHGDQTVKHLDDRLIPAWAGKTLMSAVASSIVRAHPRVGGENNPGMAYTLASVGSSPRGRGKPRRVRPSTCTGGLIPAWAGKTSLIVSPSSVLTAHPRVGGENTNPDAPVTPETGSSPRGRGKPERGRHNAAQEGLIPAWAGKTGFTDVAREAATAHPRVGGENGMYWECARAAAGSSPRGRGKHCQALPLRARRRLIPAWAGKTIRRWRSRS